MPTRGIINATNKSFPPRDTQKFENRSVRKSMWRPDRHVAASSSVHVPKHEVEASHDGDDVGDQHAFEDPGEDRDRRLDERIFSR
jgi:hypothetical protein